jgi:DNA-binding transcriptional MerR regulator/copper chaperone CopZ
MPRSEVQALTIARAARQAGVGVETIRFYERRGLIEQPSKPSSSGFRVYSTEQIARIKFIRQTQQIGFSLHEIQELLSLRADPSADCSAVRVQAVAKLEDVRRKIEQLHRIGEALEALIAACPGHGEIEACTILDALSDAPRDAVPLLSLGERASRRKRGKTDMKRPNGHRLSDTKENDVKSVTLKIEGMNCDGCAETLQALLRRQAGVKSAAVTFGDRAACVLYDPGMIDEERLVTVIERPGFRVSNRSDGA